MTDGNVAVALRGLTILRPDGVPLIEDASFTLGRGELVLLVGASGSGKSTLVNLLAGNLEGLGEEWQIAGEVQVGERVYDLSREPAAIGSVVFQNFALFDALTVAENLDIAADHNGALDPALEAAIVALLADVDDRRLVADCSGGQRQRVGIARTLLANRPLLFLDEPNSGLDVAASRQLATLIRQLVDELGTPTVVIAHHLRHLVDVADRVLAIDAPRRRLVELPASTRAVDRLLATGKAEAEEAAAEHAYKPRRRAAPPGEEPRIAWRWQTGYFLSYLWELCLAPSSLLFVALGAVIIGFVTTWFVFQYLPFRDLLLPIIHSDALAGLAFAELRVMGPLVAGILIATRSAAIICADIGHMVYSEQVKAMQNLRIPHRAYLTANILAASTIASVLLVTATIALAAWCAMATWSYIFPAESTELWRDQFFQRLWPPSVTLMEGWEWILLKAVPSITGAAAVALHFGFRPKSSVVDINAAIAKSLIWGVSLVLVWQAAVTTVEFHYVSQRYQLT